MQLSLFPIPEYIAVDRDLLRDYLDRFKGEPICLGIYPRLVTPEDRRAFERFGLGPIVEMPVEGRR